MLEILLMFFRQCIRISVKILQIDGDINVEILIMYVNFIHFTEIVSLALSTLFGDLCA